MIDDITSYTIENLEIRIFPQSLDNCNIFESIYKHTVSTYKNKCTTKGYIKEIFPVSYTNLNVQGLHKDQIFIVLNVKCKIQLIKPIYDSTIAVRIKEINNSCIIAINDPIHCIIIGLNPNLFQNDDEILVKIIETQIIKEDNTIRCTSKYLKHI